MTILKLLLLLPCCCMGGHMPSLEDLSQFVEGGCCYKCKALIMSEDSPTGL